jgi:hypothetical protein
MLGIWWWYLHCVRLSDASRMDDVEDGSELRRGLPVTHAIYGVPQTINTANYVYFLAFQELFKLTGPNEAERVAGSSGSGLTSGSAGTSGSVKGKEKETGNGKEVDLVAVVTGEFRHVDFQTRDIPQGFSPDSPTNAA